VIDNIKSNIDTHTVEGVDTIVAQLATNFRGLRPMELPKAVEPAISLARATRAHQLIDRDGRASRPHTNGPFLTSIQSATSSVA